MTVRGFGKSVVTWYDSQWKRWRENGWHVGVLIYSGAILKANCIIRLAMALSDKSLITWWRRSRVLCWDVTSARSVRVSHFFLVKEQVFYLPIMMCMVHHLLLSAVIMFCC